MTQPPSSGPSSELPPPSGGTDITGPGFDYFVAHPILDAPRAAIEGLHEAATIAGGVGMTVMTALSLEGQEWFVVQLTRRRALAKVPDGLAVAQRTADAVNRRYPTATGLPVSLREIPAEPHTSTGLIAISLGIIPSKPIWGERDFIRAGQAPEVRRRNREGTKPEVRVAMLSHTRLGARFSPVEEHVRITVRSIEGQRTLGKVGVFAIPARAPS